MRRTEIKRTCGLRRTGRLKPRSAKRRAENAADDPVVTQFRAEFMGLPCWVCRDLPAIDVHHAFGRNSKDRNNRCGLFAACRRCHDEILPGMTTHAQMVLKRIRDAAGYDVAAARRLQAEKNGRVFR